MAEIGRKLQQLRDLVGPVSQANLPRQEIGRQTAQTMTALFGFTADCGQAHGYYGKFASTVKIFVTWCVVRYLLATRHLPT